jgi:capsular exopolysaccharide synthesis family protein
MILRSKKANKSTDGSIGKDLSFSASEAYKRLRTNLMFTMTDEGKCRVLGVTSAVHGEGKSTTAVNLAYTLAEANKRVLLIDGDLRLPAISEKLQINQAPGLSNTLAGALDSKLEAIIELDKNLSVLTSGDVPPNPTELLGSAHMKELIEAFSETYDFILIDLPPVNVVADATVVSSVLDGMIVVVRNGYSTSRALNACVKQLELADVKIFGFVLNDSDSYDEYYRGYNSRSYCKYGK